MSIQDSSSPSLAGSLLIAMPQMRDPRFVRSLIYVIAHTDDGAMGLVVNQVIDSISFPDLLKQLGIVMPEESRLINVHFGGPVETGRGFVLHSGDYRHEGTVSVDSNISLTATMEILKDIAEGRGPEKCLLALGYAGWGPGQLEAEISDNGWLHVAADRELLFGGDLSHKWENALHKLGIDLSALSEEAGHA